MGLMEKIGPEPVGLDTAIFIYYMEEHPAYLPVVEPLFVGIDRGVIEGVTSELTLLEVLVVPYRKRDSELAGRYESILTSCRGLHLLAIDRAVLKDAAQLRAAFSVKTPDAIQLATALSAGCGAFLTNDRDLPKGQGIKILQLRDFLPVC